MLGPYRILRELGSGGMGTVYLAEAARETHGLESGQHVAIKVVHQHLLAAEGFFKRFLREAELGKKVRHPNIVQTIDADAILHESRQLNFIVMEFVEGQTLRDLLEELGRVPESLARHVAEGIAKALAAVHDAGAVHRDLKPENTLITRDEKVKVMDLGLAQVKNETLRLSATGQFVGSVLYAAPEQFQGNPDAIDGRADLYAVGLLLYELVCGRHPFGESDLRAAMDRQLNEDMRPPGELNPELSPFLEEVIRTLLNKEPERRIQTAEELGVILEGGEESDWWKQRAIEIRARTQRPLRRVRVSRETSLFGRRAELEELGALFRKAKTGQGQVVLLEGEAGIGKSRLVDEFVTGLQRQGEELNFLYGQYRPGRTTAAQGAFTTAFREHLGSEGLEAALGDYLKETPILLPGFMALLSGDSLAGAGTPLSRDTVQTVFVNATRQLASRRPTILLIDDLEEASDDGRTLFSAIALAIPANAVMLIGTLRPGAPEKWQSELEQLEHCAHRTLERLRAEDLEELLSELFRSRELAHEVSSAVGHHSDGNPFFAFEIVRGLLESDLLAREEDGRWVKKGSLSDIRIPDSVQELIRGRIADLEPEEKALLDVAACCGVQFEPRLVAAALEQSPLRTLKRLARMERRHRLTRTVGRRAAFDHPQIREALYQGLEADDRRRYHMLLADALERATEEASGSGSRDVELCRHLLKGGHYERARAYLEPALDSLGKVYLSSAAIELARTALGMPGMLSGDDRLRVLLHAIRFYRLLGRREEESAALAEAVALAEQSQDLSLRARARGSLSRYHNAISEYERAREWAIGGIELARAAGDRDVEFQLLGDLGGVSMILGEAEQALTYMNRNLELAKESGAPLMECQAESRLGQAYWYLNRYEDSLRHHERHLALAQGLDARQEEGNAEAGISNAYSGLGRLEDARRHMERALELQRSCGNRHGEAIALGNLGTKLLSFGHFDRAHELFERRLEIAKEIGDRRGEVAGHSYLGLFSARLGRNEEAAAHNDEALRTARQIGYRRREALLLHQNGLLAERAGDLPRARELSQQALDLFRKISMPQGIAETLITLARLDFAQVQEEQAAQRLEEAQELSLELRRPDAIVLSSVYSALVDRRNKAVVEAALNRFAEYESMVEPESRVEARFVLWHATKDLFHLEEAYRALMLLRDRVPPADRDSMVQNVPLYREVIAEWEDRNR